VGTKAVLRTAFVASGAVRRATIVNSGALAFSLFAIALALSSTAWAHAIDERHELPAPTFLFVLGAGVTVGLSFALINWLDKTAHGNTSRALNISPGPLWPIVHFLCAIAGLCGLGLVLAAAFFGTGNPMMNLAPTLVWGVWWLGGTLLVAFLGNLWPAFDPWRTMFMLLDAAARALGRKQGASLGLRWPTGLDAWPAVLFLLAWTGFELVFPLAAAPKRIGIAVIAWTFLSLLGMMAFGRDTWQRNADPFARYFDTLGRFALSGAASTPRQLELRAPGTALLATPAAGSASVGFVIAMLSTVLFDGLLGGESWGFIARKAREFIPMDANAYLLGSIGLVVLWLIFFLIFRLACVVSHTLSPGPGARELERTLAPTLVPIALGYVVAHNYAHFLEQLQHLVPLLSDPLARGWGTPASTALNTRIDAVSPASAWNLAIGAVVLGHIVAIWLAHRVMTQHYPHTRSRKRASWPMTVLMIAYTCLSLAIIAEPMVVYRGESYDGMPFDSTTWKASLAQENDNPIRLRMVDSLLRQHTLKGMDREQIVSLLGTPPLTRYFKEYTFVYWLGPERGFMSIDSEWLLIRLDENNRVTEARLARD
jgi:hypothetical protein